MNGSNAKNCIEDEEMEIETMINFVPIDEWEVSENESENEINHTNPSHPFRLGLELETGKLLSEKIWQTHIYEKEPLFTCINKEGKKLWHFEFDGLDIEIVTVPFSNAEESDLRECITSIKKAFSIVKEMINCEDKKYSIKDWFHSLQENGLKLQEETLWETLKEETISWKNGTQKWEGFIQPHVTIQLPLEKVIHLSFELFKNVPNIISIFEASLPFKTRNDFYEYFNSDSINRKKFLVEKFCNKIDGLMFLQAETLLNITLPAFINKNEFDSTTRLYNDFISFHQVCPKIYLQIMSRRPFSDMLNELDKEEKIGYSDLFKNRMKNNLLFCDLDAFMKYCNTATIEMNSIEKTDGVPENFRRATYAGCYFEGPLEKPKDLTKILKLEFFEKNEINEEAVISFLRNGYITSSMIRTLNKESLEKLNLDKILNYMNYDAVVYSVENPKWRPVIKINDDELKVVENNSENDENCPHDFISPFMASPHRKNGLSKRNCDSMGFYQNSPEIKSSQFGEAIIEIRAISFANHEELGNRIMRKGQVVPNLYLSEIEYLESDFLSLFKLIKKMI